MNYVMRRVRTAAAVAGVVCACFPSVDAGTTGVVTGRVTLTAVRSAPSPVSAYGRRGVAPRAAAIGPETRKVVVYLSSPQLTAGTVPPRPTTIVQRGEQFVPPVAVVTTGSTVRFPNEDPFFHNVFSLSRAATLTWAATRQELRARMCSTSQGSSRCSATSTRR
jgi:plastocyanin